MIKLKIKQSKSNTLPSSLHD